MASRIVKASAAMMDVLQRILKLSIQIEGLDNVTDRPTLFVVNHFTRMETFIVPYILYKHTDRQIRALADPALFKGLFGEYLTRMGAHSTREPLRNRLIVGDLVSGRHDWVIFPEGVMVKSKKVIDHGKLRIVHPVRAGRPHTGAAVLALKAAMVRNRFLRACREGNAPVLDTLSRKYGLSRERCLNLPGMVITPVNITFYPLRPNDNTISRIATGIWPNISKKVAEELKTEGSLLLKDTDMTIYFSPPVEIEEYLAGPFSAYHKLPFLNDVQRERLVLSSQPWPLTRRFMKTIYGTTAINLDHLFCIGVRELKSDLIKVEDFHRALYLSALTIRQSEDRRVHPSLHNELVKLITDEIHAPLEEIYELAKEEGIVVREGDGYRGTRRKVAQLFGHEDVRLHGTTRVIANEVEPMSFVARTVARYVNMSSNRLRAEIVRRLSALDIDRFEKDYELYYDKGCSKAPSIGRPFFLRSATSDTGILLCHGYLAAPEEMRPLGEFLHAAGYTVYGARLQGFGTGPEQLLDVTWEDWVLSFNRAYAILRNCCRKIILGGFSAGALLVLLNAARKKGAIESIFCIDTPLILMDRRACLLTPAALSWNRLMRKMHLPATVEELIVNESETPDINYPVGYLAGVRELCNLMSACRDGLPEVEAPCLIIHGSEDPVADPESAEVVYAKIGSAIKKRITIDADYHNLVQNEGRERVFQDVLRFIRDKESRTMNSD
ncbi:MAG: alpha/beta fold hydrolase [Kiritimatiellia bacterium]|jgi:esterase/lipase/1-acyl-sn-glycerol-3-phosphate acyltransferase|nr:alpha/beta fold hydrolase [Kiritimatiellia bacterium]